MSRTATLPLPVRRLLTDAEAAAYCGVSVNTFRAHVPITPVKIASCVRYDRKDLDKWLDSQGQHRAMTADDWLERIGEGGGARD